MEKSSIVRVLQWKKGFFVGSFVFYILYFGGIVLFLHHVLRWEGAGSFVEDVGILLYGLYVPVFLVQFFECYLWGSPKTGEYILSLPVKRITVFLVTAIGNFLIFSLVWILFCLLLAIMLIGNGEALISLFQGQMLVAYIVTLNLYLLTQLFFANCRNKMVALFLTLVFNVLKYVIFGGGHSMNDIDNFQQSFIYPYFTIFGGQDMLDFEGSDALSDIIMLNGGIMAAYVLLILLSIWKQREETEGLFYHSWFRFAIVMIVCFYLVHFVWVMTGDLLGYFVEDFNVFTEVLWLGVSVAIYWCLGQYLERRGGVR